MAEFATFGSLRSLHCSCCRDVPRRTTISWILIVAMGEMAAPAEGSAAARAPAGRPPPVEPAARVVQPRAEPAARVVQPRAELAARVVQPRAARAPVGPPRPTRPPVELAAWVVQPRAELAARAPVGL